MDTTARPPTVRSRPRTAGHASNSVCALVESRGISRLVGMAFFLLDSGTCILTEVADTFIRTIHKLCVLEPTQILAPATAFSPTKSKLVRIIEENTPNNNLRAISRRLFSEAEGLEYLSDYCIDQDITAVKTATSGKFFCIAAFAAGIKHLEDEHNTVFAPKTLRIQYQSSDGVMLMDWGTVRSLELISNSIEAKSDRSLLGILKKTGTAAGHRLLRSSILQPLTNKDIIEHRLELVKEFTEKETLFFDVQKAVKGQHDLERLLAVLVTKPAQVSMKFSEQRLNDVLLLKSALQLVFSIATAMSRAESALGIEIAALLSAAAKDDVLAAISELITEDTEVASSPLALRNQRCYAVKAGINGMLDLARQTYKELVDDAVSLATQYAEEYELPIQLQFEANRGFFLSIPIGQTDHHEPLPDTFVNQVKRKKTIQFSTLDLAKRNARIHEALNELLMLSDEAVEELVETIQTHISGLYKLSEAIALLDMLHAFASVAISSRYVRPHFSDDTLGIKQGKHPVKEKLEGLHYVANDTFANVNSRFQIVTGCNMAGKTTYLKANALLVVMSQIGSFVPAAHVATPIFEQLCTRFATDDGTDVDASTFSAEMQDMAFIMREAKASSLVLIDELGRGTSTSDSLAIATAICEKLLVSKATVLFATHLHELAQVLQWRPGVTCLRLRVSEEADRLTMHYQVADGTCQQSAYGLKLAQSTALPSTLTDRAVGLRTALLVRQADRRAASKIGKIVARRKAVLELQLSLMRSAESVLAEKDTHALLLRLQSAFLDNLA
ncbi:muts domain V-domain-containing protein [Protomyces lactucae-debilis]|uniref:DNA mismatch repair protein MSH3 n=1 Tax=Protomyces lactucae-debilis TaxID=2754530 RepID=A0A1Y2FGD2_PROLT|nr:muts domain V-domain-containing protein [Protomyces lactucae-debilis]ORY82474.1 muts domain V-domain-containing protein [Protomyces lactucae-debilis]